MNRRRIHEQETLVVLWRETLIKVGQRRYHVAEYKCHGCSKDKLVLGWQVLPVTSKQSVQDTLIGWGLATVDIKVILRPIKTANDVKTATVYAVAGC